jgi:hypothetical protein
MKKILLASTLSLFIFNNINAQELITQDDQLGANGLMISTTSKKRKNLNVDGTPYINETFLPIRLTSFENKNLQARYNGYNGDMEVLDVATGDVFVLNKQVDNYEVTFIGDDKTYKIYNYIDEDGYISKEFFIKLMNNNNISLLKKENVQFLGERIAVSTYDKPRNASYKRANDDYYIKISNDDDQNAIILPNKKKDIANLFPKHSKTILTYIKENKIKTSREEDLIKLLNYISTL